MDKKTKIEVRYSSSIKESERHQMIKEFLKGGQTKVEIWEKYTGQVQEHGQLLRWMRMYGYISKEKVYTKVKILSDNDSKDFSNLNSDPSSDTESLYAIIKDLKQKLEDTKLRLECSELTIDIAERELKIPIRKKSNTKY